MPKPTIENIPCRCGKEGAQCMLHNPPFPFLKQPTTIEKNKWKDLELDHIYNHVLVPFSEGTIDRYDALNLIEIDISKLVTRVREEALAEGIERGKFISSETIFNEGYQKGRSNALQFCKDQAKVMKKSQISISRCLCGKIRSNGRNNGCDGQCVSFYNAALSDLISTLKQ